MPQIMALVLLMVGMRGGMTREESISGIFRAPGAGRHGLEGSVGGSADEIVAIASTPPVLADNLQGVTLPDGLPAMIVGALLLLLGLIRLKL